MQFRHEWKHEINFSDFMAVQQRMRAIAQIDAHANQGAYQIRSLYFDNPADQVLREKIDGVNRREKFRIRYYNGDTSFIRLEKKSKINGLCSKQSAALSEQEVRQLLQKEDTWMVAHPQDLVKELYWNMKTKKMEPKIIVDYIREPFVYAPGNVRITLDYDLRTSFQTDQFLDSDCVTIPIPMTYAILEVKWDEFLPSIIRDAVQLKDRRTTAFSKYAACRIYG
ncbi:MAG: polyphosphate polymerase domain-containing protein [Massiliimalia sp.]